MLTKYAKLDILGIRSAPERVATAGLSKFADFGDYKTEDGYLYVRVRAISSRVNKNHDGWPAEELSKSYKTFIGKPVFVDHHNTDPKKARGVVVDAALHVEDAQKTSALDSYYASAPANHMPPTWIELLLEVDAKSYPKLAKAIVAGDIDGVSMGANVERSVCSHCQHEARNPEEYCKHVISKGAYFDHVAEDGTKTSKKAYEDCYDIGFFELSFVFDPADETALKIDHKQAAHKREVHIDVLAEGVDGVGPRTARAMAKTAAGPVGLPGGTPQWDDPPDEPQQEVEVEEEWEQPEKPDSPENRRIWRIQQLIQVGYDPVTAEQLADKEAEHYNEEGSRNIYPDLMGAIERGATPDQAQRIWAKHIHAVTDDEFGFAKSAAPPGVDGVNEPPQSEMTTAPDKVDTLRQEQVCPICGSDMDEGVCEVCNYEEPPEGFDNPDLEKAKEVDEQMRQEDAQDASQGLPEDPAMQVPQEPGQGPQMGAQPGAPGMTTSKAEGTADVSVEKTSQINTQERPILPATRKLTDKPLNPKTLKDSKEPVESKRKVNENTMSETTQKIADGATPVGDGVAADKRVDVEGVGGVSGDPLSGIEHQNVEQEAGGGVAPATDTWSGEKGDSLDSADAVNADKAEDLFSVEKVEVVKAGSDKTAEAQGSEVWADEPGAGVPFEQKPTRIDLEAPIHDEVGPRTQTDPNEEFRSLKHAEPKDSEDGSWGKGGPIGEAVSAVRARVFKAMKVADVEAELGLIETDTRHERAAELEDASDDALDARLDTLASVKTAGLSKRTAKTAKVGSVPSFRPVTASFDIEAHSTNDVVAEDSIF